MTKRYMLQRPVHIFAAVLLVALMGGFFIYNNLPSSPAASQVAAVSGAGSGLIAHWTLDTISGNTVPDSAGSNTGSTIGSPTVVTTGNAVGGGSLSFSGSNSVNVGKVVNSVTGDQISISTWVKRADPADTSSEVLVSKSSNANLAWMLWKTSSFVFTIASTSTPPGFHIGQASAPFPSGDGTLWHHVAAVYNGSNMIVYVDGIPGEPIGMNGAIQNFPVDVCIGAQSDAGCTFNGFEGGMDDVRIYNRALTEDEVNELCDMGPGGCPVNSGPGLPGADTVRPVVAVVAPTAGQQLSGDVSLVATASDNVGVTSVQFKIDGSNYSAEDTTAPYSINWNTRIFANGSHTVSALARDAAGNTQVSSLVTVNTFNEVDNTAPTISSVSAGTGVTSITLTWNTSEPADSQVEYGLTNAYGSITSTVTTFTGAHSRRLTGLTANRTYFYRIRSADASGNHAFHTGQFTTSAQTGNVETIGSEALVDFPTSALWNSITSFRPGEGEVSTLNPPRFSWPYAHPDPRQVDCGQNAYCVNTAPKEFIFQVSTDPNFAAAGLIVNKRTTVNGYNFLAPLPTNQTLYWRVGYIKPKSVGSSVYSPCTLADCASKWTLAADSWDADPFIWTGARTFRVASGATSWDRSKLGDEAYLAQKGAVHPRILFNNSTRADLYRYLNAMEVKYNTNSGTLEERSTGLGWKNAKTLAAAYSTTRPINDIWDALSYLGDIPSSNSTSLSSVAFVWQLTKAANPLVPAEASDAALHVTLSAKNLPDALTRLAQWWTTSGYWKEDIDKGGAAAVVRTLGYGYDWLYDDLGATRRAVVRRGIDAYLSHRLGARQIDPLTEIPDAFIVDANSPFIMGTSHNVPEAEVGLIPALATFSESPVSRRFFDFATNYLVTQPYFFAGGSAEGPQNQGGYNDGILGYKLISHVIAYQIAFSPEVSLSPKPNNHPFWKNNSDWWSRTMPVGFVQLRNPWGDGSPGRTQDIAEPLYGRNLSYLLGDGELFKHYHAEQNLLGLNVPSIEIFDELPIQYYAANNLAGLSIPTEKTKDKLSAIFPHDGWATACSAPVNTAACFNGLGFIFKAAPNSGLGNNMAANTHANYAGLSFQLWAYGAPLTDSGEDNVNTGVSKFSEDWYSILVDGIGQKQSYGKPSEPFYSRITAYKEAPNYVYVAGDATHAYPKTIHTSGSGNSPSDYSDFPATKVQRHLLMVKNKYYVVYDDLQASKPVTFSSVYHVPWLHSFTAGVATPTTKVDTLSLSTANLSFDYQTSNVPIYEPYAYPNFTKKTVPVKVKFINNPTTVRIDNMQGTTPGDNVRTNPIPYYQYTPTGYRTTTKDWFSTGDAYPRAHALWFSNATPQSNFHFMSVIFPQAPGTGPAVITRLDDFTAKVEWRDGAGTTTDIISFDQNSAQTHGATLLVNLEDLTPLPVTDDITGSTVISPPYVPPDDVPPPVTTKSLTITKSGQGSGSILGTGLLGINCSSPSCTYEVPTGTVVSLTALADPGSVFDTWSGACSGSGPCSVTLDTNTTVGADFIEITGEPEDELPPAISDVAPTAKKRSATITWTTDELATSRVQYGLTNTYGNATALNTTLSTEHSHTLSTLLPNTTYHFRVISADASTNTTTSKDYTFTTPLFDQGDRVTVTIDITRETISGADFTYTKVLPKDSQGTVVSVNSRSVGGYKTWAVAFDDTSYQDSCSEDFVCYGIEGWTSYSYDDNNGMAPLVKEGFLALYKPVVPAADITPPTVTLTSPGDSRTITLVGKMAFALSATASDDKAVTSVQFFVNSLPYGAEITTAPYSRTLVQPGTYTVYAVAKDAAGNTSVSPQRTFTLSVSTPTQTPPATPAPVPTSIPTSTVAPTTAPTVQSTSGTPAPTPVPTSAAAPAASVPISETPIISSPITKTLEVGMTDVQVSSVQTVLVSQGLLTTYRAGTFGLSTENAVKAFQIKYGLVSTCTAAASCGRVGPKTIAKLNEVARVSATSGNTTPVLSTTNTLMAASQYNFTRTLSVGSTGADVRMLQRFLNASGFKIAESGIGSPGRESTYFGPATKAALIRFQLSEGITPASGIFGPKSRAAIKNN